MSLLNNILSDKNIHRFSHHAMATIFEIVIQLDDKEYAEQAATAAFEEIDRLEEELSRFKPNSEVTRINKLVAGEELKISTDIFECLKSTNHIYNITNGLFDVTSGQIIDHWKNKNTTSFPDGFNSKNIGMDKIILDETNHSLNILSNELTIDLGGFGKGFAIDKACELLSDWDIENTLIHSGSTVKAFGNFSDYEGWPISISNPTNTSQTIAEINLNDNSLSGSGKQKGTHIINPQTALPVNDRAGTWAMSESAAISDAMSTTFMVMSVKEIEVFCKVYNSISGMIIKKEVSDVAKSDVFVANNFIVKKFYI